MSENWNTPLGRMMHPPVDRILLQRLASKFGKAAWRTIPWTRLDDHNYYELVKELRELIPTSKPFWLLEEYWEPAEAEDEGT